MSADVHIKPVFLAHVASVLGSRVVTNEMIVNGSTQWRASEIATRTGIDCRRWVGPGETALTIAISACEKALGRLSMSVQGIDAIICSTTIAAQASPSVACQLLGALWEQAPHRNIAAFDINAACAGYVYGLQLAYDMLQSPFCRNVLLVTADVLSPVLDPCDISTACLFGDAATATLVTSEKPANSVVRTLGRPMLSAKSDRKKAIVAPHIGQQQWLRMDGMEVAMEASRNMAAILTDACSLRGMAPTDLDLVVPHQANKRILNAVRERLDLRDEQVYVNIQNVGNTSSSSVPVCLDELFSGPHSVKRLGIVAFGGGFAFGAALIDIER